MVGDQLLTDIFGGNLAGFPTILVVPVAQTDGLATRFNRMVERQILKWFSKKDYYSGRVNRVESKQICIGCGVPIQTEDPTMPGYAPKSSLKNKISFVNVVSA